MPMLFALLLLAYRVADASEGMDFADDKCRAVLLAGIPYARARAEASAAEGGLV